MLSRVAENLYWIGRYVERAESTARLVSVNGHLVLDLPPGATLEWEPLVAIMGGEELYDLHYDDYAERSVVRFLVADPANPSSILSALLQARENVRSVRGVLPRDSWEQLSELARYARENTRGGLSKRGRHDYLAGIVRRSQALTGMLLGSMNHDAALLFLQLGQYLERADMTTRIVDVRSASLHPDSSRLRAFDNIQWMSVLSSLNGYQMYRLRMQARLRRGDALRFLLQDEVFPRSVMRCLALIENALAELPDGGRHRRRLADLKRFLRRADIDRMASDGPVLHDFLDQLQVRIGRLHGRLADSYFLPG